MKVDRESLAAAFGTRKFALVALDWSPFAKEARLHFVAGTQEVRLALAGVHFVSFRQSMIADAVPFGEACEVRAVTVNETDALTTGLKDDAVFGATNKMFLYDRAERAMQDPAFAAPSHLIVNCSAGILDVVCEELTLERS